MILAARVRMAAGKRAGLKAWDMAVQRIEDGKILIEVIPGQHRRSLAGSLRGKARRTADDESWEALRRAAWETSDPDRRA